MKYIIEFVASVLSFITVATYVGVFYKQLKQQHNLTAYPLQILNLRQSVLLPVFSFLLFLAVIFPIAFQAFTPIQAMFESYSVMSFFGMIVLNCGGPSNVIRILSVSDRVACCDCQSKAPKKYYSRVCTFIWQFVYIRPLMTLIAALVWYFTDMELLFQGIQGICFLQTLFMLIGLLNLAYTLYDECYGLSVVYKLMVIKISVGLVVIQGFVVDNLFVAGFLNVPDRYSFSSYDGKSKVQRAYCLLCLVEFVLLCIPLWLGFASPQEPSKYYGGEHVPSDDKSHYIAATSGSSHAHGHGGHGGLHGRLLADVHTNPVGFGTFFCDFINIWKFRSDDYVSLKATGDINYTDVPQDEYDGHFH